MSKLGVVEITERGFEIIKFSDRYNIECSLQVSSLAIEDAVWLGVHDTKPQVMASQAAMLGIETDQTTGWIPYPIPEEVFLNERMHLTRRHVEALIVALQQWLDTGSFRNEAGGGV